MAIKKRLDASAVAVERSAATPASSSSKNSFLKKMIETSPKLLPLNDILDSLSMVSNVGDSVETRYRHRIRNRSTGIRAQCVECSGGSPKTARLCPNVVCPLWAYRFGADPFRKKRVMRNN